MISNRRGHLPTGLMILVALILSGFALFVFVSFNGSFNQGFQEWNDLVLEVEFAEAYVLSVAKLVGGEVVLEGGDKEGFVSRVLERDVGYKGAEGFFGKMESGEFVFELRGENYVLEVEDVRIEVGRGDSKISRSSDLMLEFDSSGEVIK